MTAFEPRRYIKDIKIVERRGPWQSKSGGALDVLLAIPQKEVEAFLDYDNPEFSAIEEASGENIRGLRTYTVSDIPKGSEGAKEWHRARTEYVTALAGAVLWQCIDFNGEEAEFTLDGKHAIIMPPGIFHTYRALEDGTRLQVVCNTLFIPEDSRTHDSYTREDFTKLLPPAA